MYEELITEYEKILKANVLERTTIYSSLEMLGPMTEEYELSTARLKELTDDFDRNYKSYIELLYTDKGKFEKLLMKFCDKWNELDWTQIVVAIIRAGGLMVATTLIINAEKSDEPISIRTKGFSLLGKHM